MTFGGKLSWPQSLFTHRTLHQFCQVWNSVPQLLATLETTTYGELLCSSWQSCGGLQPSAATEGLLSPYMNLAEVQMDGRTDRQRELDFPEMYTSCFHHRFKGQSLVLGRIGAEAPC